MNIRVLKQLNSCMNPEDLDNLEQFQSIKIPGELIFQNSIKESKKANSDIESIVETAWLKY